jgi:DnaK suppressor protein
MVGKTGTEPALEEGGLLMLTDIDTDNNRIHMDRLVRRRDRINARLTELDAQRKQLDENTQGQDETAQQQRRKLLNYITNFHLKEIDQVDSALSRMAAGKYGLCLGCSGHIEAEWLESLPEAEFCSTCHTIRERMGAG